MTAITETLHNPEEFAQLLERVARNLSSEVDELRTAHSDAKAGSIWSRWAHNLDALATRHSQP